MGGACSDALQEKSSDGSILNFPKTLDRAGRGNLVWGNLRIMAEKIPKNITIGAVPPPNKENGKVSRRKKENRPNQFAPEAHRKRRR